MDHYYKIFPKFENFAKEIAQLNLDEKSDYLENERNNIYDRLRLPMRMFKGEKKEIIQNIIYKHFGDGDFVFSIIPSEGVSQIHTDTYYKKENRYQRYCNLAFPIAGDFEKRITYWPKLDKHDTIHLFKNSYVSDSSLSKYQDSSVWNCSLQHSLYQPVLLNTSIAHGVIGSGKTLFAYITLVGVTYEDCISLYDRISNSATI